MKAVVLAAGKGSRLKPYSAILPKPLMPIGIDENGGFYTIIEKIIRQLKAAGVLEIVVVVNYLADVILRYLKDGRELGVKISYVFQDVLDGNGGAFYRAQHLVSSEEVIITDCDNFFQNDGVFSEMRDTHTSRTSDVTVGVSRVEDITKFAIIRLGRDGKPIDVFEKPKNKRKWGNLAKSGAMILSRNVAKLDREISLTKNNEYTTTEIVRYCIDHDRKIVLHELNFADIGTWNEYIPVFKDNLIQNI